MDQFFFDLRSAHFTFADPEGQVHISLDEAFSVAVSSAVLFADVCRKRRETTEGAMVVVRTRLGVAFQLHVAEIARLSNDRRQ